MRAAAVSVLVPLSGVANGPAIVHSDYLLLSDIHIAPERAVYGDYPHPAFGITGGDGLHVVWRRNDPAAAGRAAVAVLHIARRRAGWRCLSPRRAGQIRLAVLAKTSPDRLGTYAQERG